jgi:heme exporter protein C
LKIVSKILNWFLYPFYRFRDLDFLRKMWWKYLAAFLLVYSLVMGLLGEVPRQAVLNETIRNVYFHVPMWFGMMALMGFSAICSIRYLSNGRAEEDVFASQTAEVALLYGVFGFLTGMIWGKFTWGQALPNDPKLLSVEVGMLIYSAYFILRGSIDDEQKKARLSAIYNLFAVASFLPLVWILPRLTDSLHPGNGGNPAFGKYDMDNGMRLVFYPAIIAWILAGFWISSLKIRLKLLQK